MPRRPGKGGGWRLAVRSVMGAFVAAGVAAMVTSQVSGRAVAAALFALPVLTFVVGIVIWRFRLARYGTASALPLPFVAGLVVPALVLLYTQVDTRVAADSVSRELVDPFDSLAYVSIICALVFVLLRNFEAARVRGRADAEAARVPGRASRDRRRG